MDKCSECGSERLVYSTGLPETILDPAEASGWECYDCGVFFTEDVTQRLDEQADAVFERNKDL